jgi:hypothetical protein
MGGYGNTLFQILACRVLRSENIINTNAYGGSMKVINISRE